MNAKNFSSKLSTRIRREMKAVPSIKDWASSWGISRDKGIVLKFNANLRYTTDGFSAAVLRTVCNKAQVPVQNYYNRADLPGGSTLGCISLSQVSVPSADIGLAQLAMHSCYETAGTDDAIYLEKMMAAYYGITLTQTAAGGWTIG